MADTAGLSPYDLRLSEAALEQGFRVSVLVPVYNERHVVEASLLRLLDLKHQLIACLEVIVVDDCSTDGTWDVLERLRLLDERVILLRHTRNSGKGAAIRTALESATGDICVTFDADLEYNPADIPALLVPFAREGADAVFGSRYLSAQYRRALMHRHTVINKTITFFSNWLTDLSLSDLETGLKAVNTTLLKSIPLRSNDFRFEVEIVFKLAKRRARVFEVPARYVPRSRHEGKKIRARDGLLAILAMIRFLIIDDLYQSDEYGWRHLVEVERTRHFGLWIGEKLAPYIGDRVLEIGAGTGTLTSQFIPRERYVTADTDSAYLNYLKSYSYGKPYLLATSIDPERAEDFVGLEGQFDTAILVNILQYVESERAALQNLRNALRPGGTALIVVPIGKMLYSSLDKALGRRRRYSKTEIRTILSDGGFSIVKTYDFNKLAVPGWFVNGRLLRRSKFSRIQLKIVDWVIPILKRIDRIWPWSGLSLVVVASRD
ncbi:MAG TPA: glycosyltransferase [Blastocatellia bacterium]|nr:glycosyltransferase [Blastocatellia bacterium]